jgi:hypothetical protein
LRPASIFATLFFFCAGESAAHARARPSVTLACRFAATHPPRWLLHCRQLGAELLHLLRHHLRQMNHTGE